MAVIVALLAGLVIGAGVVIVVTRARRPAVLPLSEQRTWARGRERSPAERVLRLLPTAVVLVDRSDNVRLANPAATAMGVVVQGRLGVGELTRLTRRVRRVGASEAVELSLEVGDVPRRSLDVAARAEPLDGGDVVVMLDDLTEAKRVEAVRRDFVANVGHEIKTPVGALSVLAEAALDAADDRAAVDRFMSRMQHEVNRLSRLVEDLLDLSRIQGGEPLPAPRPVLVDAVLEEAIDRIRPAAEGKHIDVVRGGDIGLVVSGDEQQLVTAVCNLLANAVAYSPDGTKIGLAAHGRAATVDVVVKDEGIGIAVDDQARIFERFYRVDPARSRETGGTGLGLSIVKHIVQNHGGEVTVWSEPGAGSTFTVRLPAPAATPTPPDRQAAADQERRRA